MFCGDVTPCASAAMLETHEIPSLYLGLTRRVTVWLPPRARGRGARFPVLYLNDGQNLFDPARAFAGNTWRSPRRRRGSCVPGGFRRLLIVGIDHGGVRRRREYLPVEDATQSNRERSRSAANTRSS